MCSRWRVAREHRGGGSSAPAGQTGESVSAVAHQRQPVGDGPRRHPELQRDRRLVPRLARPPVELDDPVAAHALGQVLVWRADHDLPGPRIGRGHGRGGGQRVVGLEVDHGPDRHAERAKRLLERLELPVQDRVHALARLVAGPERVAERLDDVIGSDAQVSDAALEHAEDRADDAADRAELGRRAPVERRARGEEVAEQLEGAVDQVHDHARTIRHAGREGNDGIAPRRPGKIVSGPRPREARMAAIGSMGEARS